MVLLYRRETNKDLILLLVGDVMLFLLLAQPQFREHLNKRKCSHAVTGFVNFYFRVTKC